MAGKKGFGGQKGRSGRRPGIRTLDNLKRYITSGYFDQEVSRRFADSEYFGDESEVRERFRIMNEFFEWFEVINSQVGFPDIILRDKHNNLIRAEVEVTSSNFLSHGHNLDTCDLIICWRHNWDNCPIPVMCIAPEWFNYRQLKQVKPHIGL